MGAPKDLLPRSRWRWAERGWYVLLSLAALFVIVAGVASAAAVNPSFCRLCHADSTQGLGESAHAGVKCDSCHTPGTTLDLIDNRLGVTQMLVDKVVPGGHAPQTYVDNGQCLFCHRAQMDQTTESNGIRMNHTAVVKAKWPCTRCHATTAHGTAASRQTGYDMDMCLQCHSANPKNIATCKTCHPDGPPRTVTKTTETTGTPAPESASGLLSTPWQATHGPDVARTHGMGNLDTCKACHDEKQCLACHKTPVPHPKNFIGDHGRYVVDDPENDCMKCHQQAACDNCHRTPMPHPEGFLQGHGKLAKAEGREDCLRCHDEKTSCGSCHIQHTHPGVPPDVLDKLRQNPAT